MRMLPSLSDAWVRALGTVSECLVFVPSRSEREPAVYGAMGMDVTRLRCIEFDSWLIK